MRKKKKNLLKNTLLSVRFQRRHCPKKSWPITTLATMGQRRHNVWVVACAGARVYRTATKYMRIIYL